MTYCCTLGDNPGLPHKFDILHVPFVLPSPKELLCHLYTVCFSVYVQAVKEICPNLN